MKIYNEIILQWDEETQSYETMYEDGFDYTGELMHMSEHLADAGPDQTVYVNSTVNLDGSASLLYEIIAYEWVQLSGTVMLDNEELVSPSFTAPSFSGELIFRLTIWDPEYNEYTDTVTISVIDDILETIFVNTGESEITDMQCNQACDYGDICVNYNELCSPVSIEIIDDECYCECLCPSAVVNDDDVIITEDDYDVITIAINYRILKDYPYKNAYGQYIFTSAREFYLNTGIKSKEYDDDLYVIRDRVLFNDLNIDDDLYFLYSPYYNVVVNKNTLGVGLNDACDSGYYFIDLMIDNGGDFDELLHCCTDTNTINNNRVLLNFNIINQGPNTQVYYNKNSNNYTNSTAPNIVEVSGNISLTDASIVYILPNEDYMHTVIYISEWGDETSTKDKETLISEFKNDKFKFETLGISGRLKHFYQTPGMKKIKGFMEIRQGGDACPYIGYNYITIKNRCLENPECLNYYIIYYTDTVYVWYGNTAPDASWVDQIDYDSAIISNFVGIGVSEGNAIIATEPLVVEDYCTRFGRTGDHSNEPWGLYESFSVVDYFEAKINLNVDEVYKDEFSEIGGTGFDYLPWPETSPVIGGISDESKYINDVINIVNQNQFKETEILDKQKAEEALQNDELGDHLGKVDLAQTRVFKGAYDMDYLLMIQNTLTYEPYYDIYDEVTNSDGYWDGETEDTTFLVESCVGLIFINDSTNSILRDNCILEFNFGDSQDDIVIDTSGQNNKGIIIGDYSLQKPSKDIPLIKDDVMLTPVTDSTDGAF